MRRALCVSVSAAMLAALAPPAGANCAEDLKKLTRARQKAADLRARLRALLLAGSTDTSEVEKPLAAIDAQADQLREATKGCKPVRKRRPRRRPRARPKARPKAQPRARTPEPSGPSSKVVLTPDTIQARPDPCAELMARAAATASGGGSSRGAHGAAGAWSERHRRHEAAHRAEAWSRELIESCRRAGERR